MSIEAFRNICNRIEYIFQEMGLQMTPNQQNNEFVFELVDRNNNHAGKVEALVGTFYLPAGVTRNLRTITNEEESIHISWVTVSSSQRGRGLGLLLLMYAICFIKVQYPHIQYSNLDDDSDRNTSMNRNIYDRLRFGLTGMTRMIMTKDEQETKHDQLVLLGGPEKHAILDRHFVDRCNYELNRFRITNSNTAMGRKKNGTHTRRSRRNRRRKSNTRRVRR